MDSRDGRQQPRSYQNVVVMRHGDRIGNFEPLGAATAARRWDPSLVDAGKVRAFCTGRKLRAQLGFPIHRIFVSPFLRCLQTAAEVATALCSVDDDPLRTSSEGVTIDPSKIKGSLLQNQAEMHNYEIGDSNNSNYRITRSEEARESTPMMNKDGFGECM